MKLIYKGKFDGNEDSLPEREHMPGAVQFKEAEDLGKLAILANGIALVITVVLLALLFWRGGFSSYSISGALIAVLSAFPHEFIHAICFKELVYLYTYREKGILFVIGTETMSKSRFIFMSMLPNLVFGIIPFIIFMIWPEYGFLGTIGALATGMGAGDYYNVYNALTQVPKGGRVYMHKFHSWWYMP